METEALIGLGGAGAVLALVSAIRQAVDFTIGSVRIYLPDRLTPIMAIGMGVGWNVGLKAADVADSTYAFAAIIGVLTGLAATGLFSGSKAVVNNG